MCSFYCCSTALGFRSMSAVPVKSANLFPGSSGILISGNRESKNGVENGHCIGIYLEELKEVKNSHSR